MAKPAVSKLADGDVGQHDTMEAAVLAAMQGLRGGDKRVEAGGAILLNTQNNKYAYTQPVGQADGAHFSASVQFPQGWKLVSLYHNHPQGPESTRFSGDDIAQAKQLGVPSYVLSHYDNRIRSFDPVTSPVTRSAGTYSSTGSLVDEPPPPTQATPTVNASP